MFDCSTKKEQIAEFQNLFLNLFAKMLVQKNGKKKKKKQQKQKKRDKKDKGKRERREKRRTNKIQISEFQTLFLNLFAKMQKNRKKDACAKKW